MAAARREPAAARARRAPAAARREPAAPPTGTGGAEGTEGRGYDEQGGVRVGMRARPGAAAAALDGERGRDGGHQRARCRHRRGRRSPAIRSRQMTCLSNERCSWVATSLTAGHAVRLADGTVGQGGACAAGAYGEATGFDNCRRGLACANGQCQPICKTSPDSRGAHFVCTNYSSVFYSNGTSVAGVWRPHLQSGSHRRATTTAPMHPGVCTGGHQPTSPELGCFGKSVFTCAWLCPRQQQIRSAPAAGPASGGFFLNGCAPGYLPVLTAMTGSTQTICVALCQPGPTSVGATTQAAGVAPYTCPAAGAAAPHECHYWWWLQNTTSASFPDALSNTMGFCIDYTKYTGDKTGAGTAPYPSCTALSATAHGYDSTLTDAQYWGCQPYPPPPSDAGVH